MNIFTIIIVIFAIKSFIDAMAISDKNKEEYAEKIIKDIDKDVEDNVIKINFNEKDHETFRIIGIVFSICFVATFLLCSLASFAYGCYLFTLSKVGLGIFYIFVGILGSISLASFVKSFKG